MVGCDLVDQAVDLDTVVVARELHERDLGIKENRDAALVEEREALADTELYYCSSGNPPQGDDPESQCARKRAVELIV